MDVIKCNIFIEANRIRLAGYPEGGRAPLGHKHITR